MLSHLSKIPSNVHRVYLRFVEDSCAKFLIMLTGNVHYITGRRPITPQGAARLEAAHAQYVAALHSLNGLRCDRGRKGEPGHVAHLNEARRRVKETLAEWLMLYEHETGMRLKIVRE